MFFNGNVPSTVDWNTYNDLIDRNICPIYVLTSQQIFLRCFPSFLQEAATATQTLLATDLTTNLTSQITDNNQPITNSLIRNAAKSLINLINLQGVGN